jgi:hypothetical protein
MQEASDFIKVYVAERRMAAARGWALGAAAETKAAPIKQGVNACLARKINPWR